MITIEEPWIISVTVSKKAILQIQKELAEEGYSKKLAEMMEQIGDAILADPERKDSYAE